MSNLPADGTHRSSAAPARSHRDEVDDFAWRYRFIKAMSSSPLREDLERCLADLDSLIERAWAARAPAGMVLVPEMDDRRRQLLAALRCGREI